MKTWGVQIGEVGSSKDPFSRMQNIKQDKNFTITEGDAYTLGAPFQTLD